MTTRTFHDAATIRGHYHSVTVTSSRWDCSCGAGYASSNPVASADTHLAPKDAR